MSEHPKFSQGSHRSLQTYATDPALPVSHTRASWDLPGVGLISAVQIGKCSPRDLPLPLLPCTGFNEPCLTFRPGKVKPLAKWRKSMYQNPKNICYLIVFIWSWACITKLCPAVQAWPNFCHRQFLACKIISKSKVLSKRQDPLARSLGFSGRWTDYWVTADYFNNWLIFQLLSLSFHIW